MNVSQFVKTVKEMRDAQKAYFKSRLRTDLIHSKELEKRVDDAISEGVVFDLDIEVMSNEPEQGNLFQMEDENEENHG